MISSGPHVFTEGKGAGSRWRGFALLGRFGVGSAESTSVRFGLAAHFASRLCACQATVAE
eukprot:15440776-Alexandrium_andersonii.AAC.1